MEIRARPVARKRIEEKRDDGEKKALCYVYRWTFFAPAFPTLFSFLKLFFPDSCLEIVGRSGE